jgi:3-hydroxymyristoyl/3-hydroxydecanoyl-(acyl carrier protein) dehydratase
MSDWLQNLPHQIPFRAASAVVAIEGQTISGLFLCTASDPFPSELMLIEAMAQFAGGLALESRGFLTGIDRCEVRRLPSAGEIVRVEVTLEASFAGTHRFQGVSYCDGVEIARGRFYLASDTAAADSEPARS